MTKLRQDGGGQEFLCNCGHSLRGHELRGSKRSPWWGPCEEEIDSIDPDVKGKRCPCKRGIRAKGAHLAQITEEPGKLYSLAETKARTVVKVPSGLDGLDKALDGGFVKNSTILLAGRRGNGKSSLMTVIAGALAKRKGKGKTPVLYVSGEEDVSQFAYRAKRFKLPRNLKNLYIMEKANLDLIWEFAEQINPGFIIIDSLQSLHGKDMNGQFVANKRTANYFSYQLKKLRQKFKATLILVGHETKSGEIAGDSSLQHDVDVVAQLDPDEVTNAKVLVIDKNRFGNTDKGSFRFIIKDDAIEEVAAIPTVSYKGPEIIG